MKQHYRLLSLCGQLAVTVAALSLPLATHADATLSGTIDAGLYRGFDRQTQIGPISRSDITFRASEALGGGIAATMTLSARFDPDTGTNECCDKPFWHGESTVGLTGPWGQVRLGRAMDAVTANDWAFDPWGNFDRIASPAWHLWHYHYAVERSANNGKPEYFRLSNGIFYDTPVVSGFSASLSGSPEKPTGPQAGSSTSHQGALKYAQGPFATTLSGGKNAQGDDVVFLGAKYKLGQLVVMGAYDRSTYAGPAAAVAYARTVGATYAIGSFLLQAGFGKLKADQNERRFIGLGSRYAMSKRTYVYVDAGHQRLKEGISTRAYGVGLNHRF